MKHSTLKKMVVIACIPLLSGFFTANAVVTIGSMKGTALPLYTNNDNGNINLTTLHTGVTFDYKLVTIGTKTWAWTNLNGATIGGATWASQYRYWSTYKNHSENNLLGRIGTAQTFGTTTNVIPASDSISFFQATTPGGNSETTRIMYNPLIVNTPFPGDVTNPAITACNSSAVTETTADLSITGSDDSGDLFYYITGNAGAVNEVSFLPTITLSGLTPLTTYNLTVTPVDFSGNMGTPANVSFTTGGLVQVTSGIAQGVKFVLKSTSTQLEFYYQPVDPTKKFRDTSLKITPAGGAQLAEIKPTMSPDSTYAYAVTSDASIANKIISINCGYWFAPGLPDYSDWVTVNNTITSGALTGTPIKHQMGGGISATERETNAPVLNSVTLADATSKYVKLNIDGSDNSGNVYYTITGGKQTEDAFHTGNYYITSFDPGKIYNLSVTPYDLSGNTAAAKTLTIKTMNARSNIKDSTTTAYNTLVLPTAPGGELVTIIKLNGNQLTLGCTTKSLLIPAGASRNKVFTNPTVVINGTSYPLTLDAAGTTATVTFNGTIGSTSITNGLVLKVQWSTFWPGNYFTGTFTYVVGDTGQSDVTGPSTPVLTLNGSALTWPAGTDDLSGVKSYIVSESGQAPVTIFDLGQSSFTYNMVNPASITTVKAVDFVGNSSALAKVNDIGTVNNQVALNSTVIYPNPATDRIYISGEVSELALYSLQGQLVRSVVNKNSMDVSSFAKGMYIVRTTDKAGIKQSSKLEIQ